MSANRIVETSTSVGTGDFALNGTWQQAGTFNTGNRSFNSFYGLNHYFPYQIQDTAGNWEKGIGYLSNATTLVRDSVSESSLGAATPVNFGAGQKLVMVPSDAGAQWPLAMASSQLIKGGNLRANSVGTLTLAANRIHLTPFLVKRPMAANAIAFEVVTAVASTNVRAGIYSTSTINPASPNLRLVAQGAVSSATTGSKEAPLSAKIGQGYYFLAVCSDGAPTLRTLTSHYEDAGWTTALTSTQHNGWSIDIAGSAADLPSSITGALTGLGSGVSIFHGLKGAML